MADMRVLIAAAGTGSRAGLAYPKTLFPIHGKPILVRIHELLAHLDACPTVIVNPAGHAEVAACLTQRHLAAHLVVQPEPHGMGDAVLRFMGSPAFSIADNVLLIWGDIPFIQPQTVAAVVNVHREQGNDFTFATSPVDAAYTVVVRDAHGHVADVIETREADIHLPRPGERDIGLFVFRKQPVFELLQADLPGKWGQNTGEHGFLYVIRHMAARGFRVQGLPVATRLDLVSFNAPEDIEAYR